MEIDDQFIGKSGDKVAGFRVTSDDGVLHCVYNWAPILALKWK